MPEDAPVRRFRESGLFLINLLKVPVRFHPVIRRWKLWMELYRCADGILSGQGTVQR